MTGLCQILLTQLGFRFGLNGPHAARTMMLGDLRLLLARTSAQSTREDYSAAVLGHNVLGKSTRKARELALRHLSTLYGLTPTQPLFRALRRLWPLQESAQPLLALAVALARDPLLRGTQFFVLSSPLGSAMPTETFQRVLCTTLPDRFSPASLQSFARNIAGSWTAGGLLQGRAPRYRSRPVLAPESVAMLLFLGYLEGLSGQRLFSSSWMQLLDATSDELEGLASVAADRGLLVFMRAGGIQEVRFPGYLTAEEERIRQDASHVI